MPDALPTPNANGSLRVVAASDGDNEAQVLLLEFSSYRHVTGAVTRRSTTPSVVEAENRLARDVRDFLTYARGQGL